MVPAIIVLHQNRGKMSATVPRSTGESPTVVPDGVGMRLLGRSDLMEHRPARYATDKPVTLHSSGGAECGECERSSCAASSCSQEPFGAVVVRRDADSAGPQADSPVGAALVSVAHVLGSSHTAPVVTSRVPGKARPAWAAPSIALRRYTGSTEAGPCRGSTGMSVRQPQQLRVAPVPATAGAATVIPRRPATRSKAPAAP